MLMNDEAKTWSHDVSAHGGEMTETGSCDRDQVKVEVEAVRASPTGWPVSFRK